jgi:hypothetical protein
MNHDTTLFAISIRSARAFIRATPTRLSISEILMVWIDISEVSFL